MAFASLTLLLQIPNRKMAEKTKQERLPFWPMYWDANMYATGCIENGALYFEPTGGRGNLHRPSICEREMQSPAINCRCETVDDHRDAS